MSWHPRLVKQSSLETSQMSTIHVATELRQASPRRQVYSPLEAYWDAFQQWRKRKRLQSRLCNLTDRELMDIGITRGEINYVSLNQSIDPRGACSTSLINR
jgi:uncharacterized protein YjiS (DUF1127 family)